jgi:hypothetical protein
MPAARLRGAFVAVLALYLVAVTLPWFRVHEQGLWLTSSGWQFAVAPQAALGFLLLAFSWGERSPAVRRVLRDGSVLLVVCTVAGTDPFGFDLLRKAPHLTGPGATWWLWLALVASVAAAVLGSLLVRGTELSPARAPSSFQPLAAWPFVLPLLVLPALELVPNATRWPRPAQWESSFTFSVVLAAWALAVRRGVAPTEVGLRVARELGRLVALFAVVGYAVDLLLVRARITADWSDTLLALPFALGAPLVAWLVASAWARGGYRELTPAHVPEILRVDRLGPDDDA